MTQSLRSRAVRVTALAVVVAVAVVAGVASAAHPSSPHASTGSLTTYDWNNQRTGHDTTDPAIHAVSAAPAWSDALDGAVFGQPLVDDGVVYVGTENDSLYAISASTGAVRWHLRLGLAPTLPIVDAAPTLGPGCGDISPLGITGTPVIDTKKAELFVVAEVLIGGAGGAPWTHVRHWMVAVSLKHHSVLWHTDVDPPGANEPAHYYIAAEQERTALTLFRGRVYAEYGGLFGDCGQYHGYVVSLTEKGASFTSYEVPSSREAGIWGTAGAVVSSAGNLYVATGNGASNTVYDEGNSVIELSPALKRLGYFAPANWVQLNEDDWDLGSASPIEIPGTSLLFAAGKPGANGTDGYLMGVSPLGGIGHGAFTAAVCPGGGVFGADAADVVGADTYVYAPCGSGTEGLRIHTASPHSFAEAWHPSSGSPDGPPIVAGGYVWALDWGAGSGLYGMSPTTGAVVFQRPTGSLVHFATPGFGDGVLVVPTRSGVEAFRTSS